MAPPPPASPQRMTAGRKRAILEALNAGRMSLSEAADRHSLSAAELAEWQARYRAGGIEGLRAHRRAPGRDA